MRTHRIDIFKLAATGVLAAAPGMAVAQTAPAVPPTRKTVARISLISKQPELMKRFYTEVFGFIPIWEGMIGEGANAQMIADAWHLAPGARLNGALMKAPRGDMELQITYVTGQEITPLARVRTEAPHAGEHYFVIHVPELNPVVEKLAAFNTEYNRPPMEMTAIDQQGRSYPVFETVIYDPDGTILIIVQDVVLPS